MKCKICNQENEVLLFENLLNKQRKVSIAK